MNDRNYKIVVLKSKNNDFLEILKKDYLGKLAIEGIFNNGGYYIYELSLLDSTIKKDLAALQDNFL